MFNWRSFFLVIALLTGTLSMLDAAGSASSVARIAFILFMAMFFISYLLSKRPPVT